MHGSDAACIPGQVESQDKPYVLEDQVGFVLRRANQRHLAIFAEAIPGLTTTQFTVLVRLHELGPLSQNHLGRVTAMDGATIKGVVDRLARQGLVATAPDPGDRRRLTVSLTESGAAAFAANRGAALEVSRRTLAPLSAAEQARFLDLLNKLA
ncbi:MarR family transcriptional regulator [Frigidibacter albus]|uniref:Transcriptional regulator n=1 Tax=Frigidibacter mobilis TaxID=1335048 RepID=A0A159Z6T5_9RHOB|nr:transcriptional regulator [Frigidibacter mobilis]